MFYRLVKIERTKFVGACISINASKPKFLIFYHSWTTKRGTWVKYAINSNFDPSASHIGTPIRDKTRVFCNVKIFVLFVRVKNSLGNSLDTFKVSGSYWVHGSIYRIDSWEVHFHSANSKNNRQTNSEKTKTKFNYCF